MPRLLWRASPPAERIWHPFNPEAHFKEGDIFRYRPLGSPLIYFAKVLKYIQGIVTVHIVGPMHLLQGLPTPEDISICLGRPPSRAR